MNYSMKNETVEQAAGRVGAEVSSAIAGAGEKVAETATSVRNAAVDSFDKVETAIRRNPIAATSIAVGIGFFLAILARR